MASNLTSVRLLAKPQVTLLWLATWVSLAGDAMFSVAVIWTAATLDSPMLLALFTSFESVPRLLVLILAGRWMDRIPLRVLPIFPLIAALFAALPIVASRNTPVLGLAAIAVAGISTIVGPLMRRLLNAVVERDQIFARVTLFGTTNSLVTVVAPALAGLAIASSWGAVTVYLVDSVSFVASAICVGVVLLNLPATITTVGMTSAPTGMSEAFRWGLADSVSRAVAGAALADKLVTFGPIMLGVPLLVGETLNLGSSAYGFVMGSSSAGMLLGGLVLSKWGSDWSRHRMITAGYIFTGLGEFAVAVSPTLAWVVVSTFALSFFIPWCMMTVSVILQERSPDWLLGRALAAFNTLDLLAGVVSLFAAGLIARQIPPRALFVVAGAAYLATGVWLAGRSGYFVPLGEDERDAAGPPLSS